MINLNKRLLVNGVICFISGHVIASISDQQLLLLSVSAFVLIFILIGASRHITWRYMIILLLIFVIGFTQRILVDRSNVSHINGGSVDEEAIVYGEGIIHSEVEVDGDTVKFILKSRQIRLSEHDELQPINEKFMVHVKLSTEEEQKVAIQWHRGMNVSLSGQLAVPMKATNYGAFDYQKYLKRQSIHWLWKVQYNDLSNINENWNTGLWLHKVDRLRLQIARPLDVLFNEVESGYLKGLILGIRSDVDPEQFRSFSTLGLTHILAISGLHVAVFMYIITAFLKVFRLTKEQIIIALLVLIPCYVVITGGSPSVVRAGLMAMIALYLAMKGKLKDGLHIIALVAALLILWEPYMIHNVSFQLSFIVTLGLIIGVPAINKLLSQHIKLKWFNDLLGVTVVAQVISFPLTIYYFNQFHLLSLLANFVLVPFISMLVMPLGSLALLLGHISHKLASPVAMLVHWSNEASFALVQRLSEVRALHTIWASPSLLWIAIWYGCWLYIFNRWNLTNQNNSNKQFSIDEETKPIKPINDWELIYRVDKKKYQFPIRIITCTSIIIALIVIAYYPNLGSRTSYVSFLDIGQGDSSLVRTPYGKNILIDGGGAFKFGEQAAWKQKKDPFEVGRKVLVPLLMKRGVHQIDILIITHLDADHIGGLYEVINTIPVKEVWWNGTITTSNESKNLMELVMKRKIPIKTPVIGEKLVVDEETTITMLWPNDETILTIDEHNKQNELSLVFILSIYDSKFLYTGDIGITSEEQIVQQIGAEEHLKNNSIFNNRVDVMKAAHHGSKYSTHYSWLSHFAPTITVISAGRDNRYGHPHQDVLQRLELYQSIVKRTDLEGEIRFKVKRKARLYYENWN